MLSFLFHSVSKGFEVKGNLNGLISIETITLSSVFRHLYLGHLMMKCFSILLPLYHCGIPER